MPHTARAPTVFDPALLGWVGVERADGWVARSLRSVGAARQSSESAANSSAAWDDGEDEIEDLDVTPGSADADVVAGPEAPHDEEPEDTIADGAGDGDGGIHVYGWTEWPLRGVNSVKVGASSVPRFGTTPGIVEDVARLPVDVIRQPGAADLLIPFLMPVEPDEVLRLPLAEDILGSFDGTALGELLLEAARRGLKVSLTLGTLGAGAAGEFGEDPSEAVFRPIGLLWSRSHVGASLDGSVFCEGSTDSARRKFLDIRDRYQRRWLREYTRFACALLVDIEGDIRDELEDPTFVLERVVHCIEIFNEIDTCNVVRSSVRNSTFGEESWKSTAYWWARTCYSMARAVETELGGRIPAWLPGLASYDVDEALLDERTAGLDQNVEQYVHTWAWKINFYAEFARRFSILANRDGYTSRTVATIAGGVDYHWYHRKSADRSIDVGALHISRLVFEVEQLRAALDDVGLGAADMTVQESGTSATSSDEYCPHRVIGLELSGESFDALEVFQAHEVWRRQCGAAGAGAAILGWHAFQSDFAGDFAGMGLRDHTERGAADSRPHLAWFAYERFGELIRYFSSCTLLTLAGEIVNRASTTTRAHDVVVFEFQDVVTQSHRTYPYAYVVLLDQWRNTRSEEIFGDVIGGDAELALAAVYPNAISLSAGTGDRLPSGTATYSSDQVITGVGGLFVFLESEAPCWLYYSNRRIAWSGWE